MPQRRINAQPVDCLVFKTKRIRGIFTKVGRGFYNMWGISTLRYVKAQDKLYNKHPLAHGSFATNRLNALKLGN
jgi:hypothetical protein